MMTDLKLVPATYGKFQRGQMVEVCKDQPDFNKAVCAYPEIGVRGMVVITEATIPRSRLMVPEGKVAVRFSSKLLGYLDYLEKPFQVIYCWEWALKPAQ